ILIPVAGFGSHDPLRVRVAASLWRASQPEIKFIQILPSNTPREILQKNNSNLTRFARRIIPGKTEIQIISNDDVETELINQASGHDLVIMGLGKAERNEKAFGHLAHALAKNTNTALIFISKK